MPYKMCYGCNLYLCIQIYLVVHGLPSPKYGPQFLSFGLKIIYHHLSHLSQKDICIVSLHFGPWCINLSLIISTWFIIRSQNQIELLNGNNSPFEPSTWCLFCFHLTIMLLIVYLLKTGRISNVHAIIAS